MGLIILVVGIISFLESYFLKPSKLKGDDAIKKAGERKRKHSVLLLNFVYD